jgi:hypothetical protein
MKIIRCPLCNIRFPASGYLNTAVPDKLTRYFANLVTHYRHNHIKSWNKCWGYKGRYYRKAAHFGDYDDEKQKVNERAKRQLIRKCKDRLNLIGLTPQHINQLASNDEETIALANKLLRKGQRVFWE